MGIASPPYGLLAMTDPVLLHNERRDRALQPLLSSCPKTTWQFRDWLEIILSAVEGGFQAGSASEIAKVFLRRALGASSAER